MTKQNSRLRQLMVTTALGGLALFGYGRGAYAGGCTVPPSPFICSGAIAGGDLTQTLSGSPLSVTLGADFGIDTYNADAPGGDAFYLTGSSGLTVDGSASNISITGYSDGIDAYNSGGGYLDIDTTGGSVTGVYGYGIWSYNDYTGSAGTSNSGLVITTGNVSGATGGIWGLNEAYGKYGSDLTINSSLGSVSGFGGDGIYAYNYGTTGAGYISGSSNLSVTTAQVFGGTDGIVALNGGYGRTGNSLTINSTLGTVTGTAGNGILAINNGSASDWWGSSNLTVTTANVSGGTDGIFATNNGYGFVSNLTVSTTGGAVTGTAGDGIVAINNVYTYWGHSDLSVTTANVTGGSDGIVATNNSTGAYGSSLAINSTLGTVTGIAGDGILAINNGSASDWYSWSSLTVTTGTVTGGNDGVVAVNNGDGGYNSILTITVNGGTVTGTAGYGISADNNSDGATDINIVNGGSVEGGTAAIYVAHSSGDAFTIDVGDYSSVSSLSGYTTDLAINAESTGTGLTLTIDTTSTLTGTVDLTDQGDIFNNNGTWYTTGGTSDFGAGYDVLNNTSSLTIVVGNGSPGQNTWLNNLELFANGGRVDFADGYASDTLTLSGDFDGTGGVLEMDVYLDSVAPTADMFVINGDVVGGPTDIELFNVGGDGAFTGWGQDDGIALVDVSNTGGTAGGDFQINSGIQVGLVYYGDIVLGTDSIWRLQSSYLPTIPAYEVYTSALLNMTQLPTYRERRGSPTASMSSDGGGIEVWLRTGGTQLGRGDEGSITETEYDQTYVELVAGVDFQVADELTAGASLRYVTGSTDVTSPHGDSSIDTSGFGIGGTMTWQAPGGTYVDGQARYMFYDSDFSGQTSANSASGFAVSAEAGHKIPIAANWSVVPQGQLSYTSVNFDDIAGPFDETARLVSGESIIARAGASLDREWAGSGGAHNSLYGSLNVSYDFKPETAVDVSSVTSMTFERSADPTRIELGVGGTIGLGEQFSLYGTLSASQGVDDFGDSGDLGATIGVNFKW